MSSFTFSGPAWQYALWNLASFALSFFANSFIEWAVHRFVMHRRFPFIPYGYEHTTSHHAKFGADESYHAREEWLKSHVLFTWREYTLLPLLCLAAYAPVELALGRPVLLGVLAATFAGLQMFNSLHWRFHVPSDTWFQRTRFFLYLKEHHRIHHADMTRNFNVYFFPIADWAMGTLRKDMPTPASQAAEGAGNPAGA